MPWDSFPTNQMLRGKMCNLTTIITCYPYLQTFFNASSRQLNTFQKLVCILSGTTEMKVEITFVVIWGPISWHNWFSYGSIVSLSLVIKNGQKTFDQLSHARQMLRNFLASGHHRLRHLLCDKRLKKHFILKPKGRGQEASDDAKVRINSAKRSSLSLVF